MKRPKIEVFEDRTKGWRWRLVGANGEVAAQSEHYPTFGNAHRAARSVKRLAFAAKVEKV